MNAQDGKVSHAVIGLGGFAGVGERKVVVPWNQVKISVETARGGDAGRVIGAARLVATVDQPALDSAARFTTDRDRDRAPAASPATGDRGERRDRGRPQERKEGERKY